MLWMKLQYKVVTAQLDSQFMAFVSLHISNHLTFRYVPHICKYFYILYNLKLWQWLNAMKSDDGGRDSLPQFWITTPFPHGWLPEKTSLHLYILCISQRIGYLAGRFFSVFQNECLVSDYNNFLHIS